MSQFLPRRLQGLLVVILAALAAIASAPREHHGTRTHTVTIEGASFSPAALTVALGDTVQWVNKDPYPHTATAKAFNSGTILTDKSWKVRLDKRGEFAYICSLHQTMKGVLTVR